MTQLRRQVRDHLVTLDVPETMREEVIREISEHLEDAAKQLESSGLSKAEALDQVLSQVGDWSYLVKGIQRNKEIRMRDRFRRLWLPALGIGALAFAAQFMIVRFAVTPRSMVFNGTYYSYVWQWYSILLFTGALGALWSRRLGGSVRERILVALAPSLVMGIVFLLVIPINLTISVLMGQGSPYIFRHPAVMLPYFLTWVLLPAIPSVLGAYAFLSKEELKHPAIQ